MEAPTRERSERLVYQVHDLIPIPEDLPALEVKKGDEGIVRELVLRNGNVITAFVEVPYSTGQTRGWVVMETAPTKKVLSYTEV